MIAQATIQTNPMPRLVEDSFGGSTKFMPSFDTQTEVAIDIARLNSLAQAWCNIKDRRSADFCWKDYVQYSVIKLDHSHHQAALRSMPTPNLGSNYDVSRNTETWQTKARIPVKDNLVSREYSPRLDDIMSIESSLTQRKWQRMSVLNTSELPCTLGYFKDRVANVSRYNVLQSNPARISPQTAFERTCGESKLNGVPTACLNSSEHDSVKDCRRHTSTSFNEIRDRGKSDTGEISSFNAGACSLKLSFNAHDLREARHLHDQLCVLSPITLALTANSPGDNEDLAQAQWAFNTVRRDERTSSSAKDFSKLKESTAHPTYLSADALRFGSVNTHVNHNIFHYLRSCGLDDAMAMLCAQQTAFPGTLFEESATQRPVFQCESDTGPLSFFSSLNRHVELRPPSANDSTSAFCVNLDAMEMQLTDFANAACVFFVVMLRFAILGFDLDFRIPPSQVAENLSKAKAQNAVIVEKFWWRMPRWRMRNLTPFSNEQCITTDAEPTLLSIDHIVNGDPSRPETIGLSGVVEAYLADIDDGSSAGGSVEDLPSLYEPQRGEVSRISGYLALIRQRAKGTLPTHAQWTRRFIEGRLRDRDWRISSPELLYDLFGAINDLNIAASSGFGF